MSDQTPIANKTATNDIPNRWLGVRIIEPDAAQSDAGVSNNITSRLSKTLTIKTKQFLRKKKLSWVLANTEEVLAMTINQVTGFRYYELAATAENDDDMLVITFRDWSSKELKRNMLLQKLRTRTIRG